MGIQLSDSVEDNIVGKGRAMSICYNFDMLKQDFLKDDKGKT